MNLNLSTILDPFGSNQFMSCPWVTLFFHRLQLALWPVGSSLTREECVPCIGRHCSLMLLFHRLCSAPLVSLVS